jgi:SH3 domain protein
MKKLNIFTIALIILTFKVSAESFVYITDELDLPIRSDKNFGNNIIRLLPSGTELSLLQSTEDGWAQIQFDDTIGWIKTFYLSSNPSAREELKKLTREYNSNTLLISKLSDEKEELEKKLLSLKNDNTDLIVQSSKSQAEKEHIEQIYQDALKLEHENEKLIQNNLQLKAELQLAENNTQIQKDTSSRNWFIVGAIVLFLGMIIGLIVPNLLKRRRF